MLKVSLVWPYLDKINRDNSFFFLYSFICPLSFILMGIAVQSKLACTDPRGMAQETTSPCPITTDPTQEVSAPCCTSLYHRASSKAQEDPTFTLLALQRAGKQKRSVQAALGHVHLHGRASMPPSTHCYAQCLPSTAQETEQKP